MRFKTTLILILVLVAVVLLIQYTGDEGDVQPAGPDPLFPGVNFNSVDRIEMEMYMGQKAVLERNTISGRWWILEPFSDQANQGLVETILATLEENIRVEVAPSLDGVDLTSKGLHPAQRAIVLHDSRGTHRLNVGLRDPLGTDVFVTLEGYDALYRTGANVINLLEKNPPDLRDDRLFRIDPLIVDAVEISGPEGLLISAARKRSDWRIVAPLEDEANNSTVQNLITRLCRLKVNKIFLESPSEEELEAFGFSGGTFRIVLRSGNVERAVIFAPQELGPSGSLYCTRKTDDAILIIDRTEFTRLNTNLDTYRSKQLVPAVREDLHSLAILRGAETWLVLAKDRGIYFSIKAPFEAPADHIPDGDWTPVSFFLSQLLSLQADDFVSTSATADDMPALGLDVPAWRVQIRWKRGGSVRSMELAIGGGGGDFVNAVRSDKPRFVYSMRADLLEFLEKDPLLLRDRRVFYEDLINVNKADFMLGSRTFTIARAGSGGAFQDDPNNRFQVFLNELTKELVLRYEPGASKPDDPRFAAVWGAVRYHVDEPGRTAREIFVELGTENLDGYFGRSNEIDRGTFVVEKELFEKFNRLFEGI